MAAPVALIYLCVADATQHRAFALAQLGTRVHHLLLIHGLELVELVGKTHTAKRLRFVLGRVVNNPNITPWRSNIALKVFHVGLHATLHIVLVVVLDALELVLLVSMWLKFVLIKCSLHTCPILILFFCCLGCCFSFFACVRVQEVEELDKCVVRHLLTRIGKLFSLRLHVIVLIIFVVTVVRLRLQGWALCVRVQIVHVWEAHTSKLCFVLVLGYVHLTWVTRGRAIGEVREWTHFSPCF